MYHHPSYALSSSPPPQHFSHPQQSKTNASLSLPLLPQPASAALSRVPSLYYSSPSSSSGVSSPLSATAPPFTSSSSFGSSSPTHASHAATDYFPSYAQLSTPAFPSSAYAKSAAAYYNLPAPLSPVSPQHQQHYQLQQGPPLHQHQQHRYTSFRKQYGQAPSLVSSPSPAPQASQYENRSPVGASSVRSYASKSSTPAVPSSPLLLATAGCPISPSKRASSNNSSNGGGTRKSRPVKRQKRAQQCTAKLQHQQQYHTQPQKRVVVLCDKLAGKHVPRDFEANYTLGDQLGSGGFGVVLSATRHADGREVAAKFIYRDKIRDHSWVQDSMSCAMLPMELHVLLQISVQPHPNIIGFHEYFVNEDFYVLVMELHGSPWTRKPSAGGAQTQLVKQLQQQPAEARMPLEQLPLEQYINLPRSSNKNTSKPLTYVNTTATEDDEDDDMESYRSSEDEDYIPPASSDDSDDDMVLDDDAASEYDMDADLTLLPPPDEVRYAAKRDSHDLFEMIESRRNLTERQVRYMMRQLVDALWYLDSLNIYHRDIKDENILVDESLHIKLIDFGSSVVLPPHTQRTQFEKFYGTQQYAPVEVLCSQPYDAEKSDVWALGILLFTCLTGQTPFRTPEDAVTKDWELARNVSQECRTFLRKCLQKNPKCRATFDELARERWWLVDLA
ncbi:kinase-like domain-containing protein [Limtongia smithiae]|uniref:kinase-like domain-containing protein n=1 Tax=Limtongia smithiae TaxID=1125753 RepID=UPI0034CD2EB2